MKPIMIIEFYDPETNSPIELPRKEVEDLEENLEEFLQNEGYYGGVRTIDAYSSLGKTLRNLR